MRSCIRCRVYGRVQGVWFRGSAQQQASRLGITGYAKNLDDGSVEVVACGEQSVLDELHEWLWQGPSGAKVTNVFCEKHGCCDYRDFTTA